MRALLIPCYPRQNLWHKTAKLSGKGQLFRRTARRVLRRERLWQGNRERLLTQIASRDSLFLWAFHTYGRHRRVYPTLLSSPGHSHLRVARLRSPRETQEWLEQVTR